MQFLVLVLEGYNYQNENIETLSNIREVIWPQIEKVILVLSE